LTGPVSRRRIAIGQISQESNAFVTWRTELAHFQNSYLLEGDDVLALADSQTEVAGAIAAGQSAGVEIVPLLATRSVSGGPLSAECYAELKSRLLACVAGAGALDGVFLSLHGSMLADGEDDPEGDLLAQVRTVVGYAVPVVATLDLHANVTQRMIDHATALVAYTHYPHDDALTTGERGMRLLLQTVSGAIHPVTVMAKVPMLVAGCNGQTFGDAPMHAFEQRARAWEDDPRVCSVSNFHVHPYLDQPGLGCGGVAITDGDPELAEEIARSIANGFWERRAELMPEVFSIAAAVEHGRSLDGPVVLVDTADCCGGGAAGDSIAALRELLALGVDETTHLMVVDPAAAAVCIAAGIDAEVTLSVGYGIDPSWGEPITITGVVQTISDGRFLYEGGLFGGTWGSMGPSAVLRIGGIRLLIMSEPTYDWLDEQYRAVGLDPRRAKFIGAKNPMNYRFAYGEIAAAMLVVDTPGPTPAHVRHLPYERIDRPAFPFEDSSEPPRIEVLRRSDRSFVAGRTL
jgi:microcystin degradation protein MlrC